MKYNWKLNASTGNHIAQISETLRLVRSGHNKGYLYEAEEWGDYSLAYPVQGGWFTTPAAALKALGLGKVSL